MAVIRDKLTTRLAARSETRQQEGTPDSGRSDHLPGGWVRVTLRTCGDDEACWTPTKPRCHPSVHRYQQWAPINHNNDGDLYFAFIWMQHIQYNHSATSSKNTHKQYRQTNSTQEQAHAQTL